MANSKIISFFITMIAITAIVLLISDSAFASAGMPWETPLEQIKNSITGPVALVVSLVAIVAVGITLIFGGDMQGFIRQMCYIVLVVGIIVCANTLLTKLYSGGDAVTQSSFIIF